MGRALSGLAHPLIGVDHLAFIVAAGLIATRHHLGICIPIAFVTASLVGTGLHVSAFDLPASGYLISLSVVFMGSLLVIRTRSLFLLICLASAAGILHGYAYGESIVGAEMTALSTYLLGLTLVQLAIGLSTERVFRAAVGRTPEMGGATLRWAAVAVCSVGVEYGGMQWLQGFPLVREHSRTAVENHAPPLPCTCTGLPAVAMGWCRRSGESSSL